MKKPDYGYQKNAIKQGIKILEQGKNLVLASAPGSGKTNISIQIIKKLLAKNSNAKFLVLTHGQNVLRTQYYHKLTEIIPKELVTIIQNQKIDKTKNIFITLPQSLNRKRKKYANFLKTIDYIIVDEAHQFYLGKMVTNILDLMGDKPKLLLTGSPSKFVGKEGYEFIFIALEQLLKHNVISDAQIKLLSTASSMTYKDLNPELELRKIKLKNTEVFEAVNSSLDYLVRLKREKLKTIITCKDIEHANQVALCLTGKYKFNISNYLEDKLSEDIEAFRSNDIPYLIVINRGILGFDMPELSNVIDLSYSHNPDKVFQLFSRVIRRYKTDKLFIKVTNPRLEALTYLVSSFVLAMSVQEIYSTYKRNFKEIKFHVNKKAIRQIKNRKNKLPFLALPELPTLKKYQEQINQSKIYAKSSIGEAILSLGGFSHYKAEDLLKEARKYKTIKEWRLNSIKTYNASFRHGIHEECVVHMPKAKCSARYNYTYENCKISASKYKTLTEWATKEQAYYNYARINGWTKDLIIPIYEDKANILKEAKKYKTKSEWSNRSRASWKTARKFGEDFYSSCVAHMEKKKSMRTYKECLNFFINYQKKKNKNEKDFAEFLKIRNYSRHKKFYKKIQDQLKNQTI